MKTSCRKGLTALREAPQEIRLSEMFSISNIPPTSIPVWIRLPIPNTKDDID